MEIREVTKKEAWENFLLQCTEKTFLQSWSWGEFNMVMGNKIWRFGAYSGERLISVSLVVKVSARRGTFLLLPHGPVVIQDINTKDKKEILELLLVSLSDVAKEEKASFIRVSPIFSDTEGNRNIFADLGFRDAPMHSSAYEATWCMDIFPAQGDILHNMRKTTRYLIKKTAENPDITTEISADPKNIEIYQKLNKDVAKRQNFKPFSDKLIRNEFEVFSRNNQAVFIFGKYKGEIAAGAIIIFWSQIAFYHQAASLAKFAKYSIPYLMQWEAIKEAEKRGCKIYDFWGFTDPEKFPKHPWAGPTLFKMGFGGYKSEQVKTQDFVLSKKYWLNYIIENIRKAWRRL
jgi:lipid II:glycine glycyltransferase (peptidoglycan interpeptide bridge formation enzyme)